MINTFQYRNKIVSFLDDNDFDSKILAWLDSMPENEHGLIIMDIIHILNEQAQNSNTPDWQEKLKSLKEKIHELNIADLNKRTQEALDALGITDRKELSKRSDFSHTMAWWRENAIIDINATPENPELWAKIDEAIKFEKHLGVYDPEDWKELPKV